MTATTDNGHYTVALTLSGDGVHGEQDVTLALSHHGTPEFIDAVSLDAVMPAHGHGTNEVTVEEGPENGVYTATGLDLMMPGAWELTVEIDEPGHGGTAVFLVEIE
jgi:FixH.